MTVPKLTPPQRRLLDEYAELRAKVASWKPPANPDAARLAELSTQVLALADQQPADAEVLLVGNAFSVPVGMKRVKRSIVNLPKLFKRLGRAWVETHCQPSLGDLDKAELTAEEKAEFVNESRELSRIIGTPAMALPKRKAA